MAHKPHHGKNIRNIRLLRNMKQDVFARKMGVTQQSVSFMETRQTWSQRKLSEAAKALDVSVETIETFDENTLLLLAEGIPPNVLNSSEMEMINFYQGEISRKEIRITQLEMELDLYRNKV